MNLKLQRLMGAIEIGTVAAGSHRLPDAPPPSTKPSILKPTKICTSSGACRVKSISFEFDCSDNVEGLIGAQRLQFVTDFRHELKRLDDWASGRNWTPSTASELNVFVSDQCRISKSLVPAWSGSAGYMEFPMWRVASREAAIMHELVHVFFPNGNRFLAEGLAVYLQTSIGGNPAFPNFGTPLHKKVREGLGGLTASISRDGPITLGEVDLFELDRIPTPNPLTLRVGSEIFAEDSRGQAFLYPITGSFVEFLIESRGIERFLAAYEQTPLVALVRNAGSSDRWRNIYPSTLPDLENEWKSAVLSDFL